MKPVGLQPNTKDTTVKPEMWRCTAFKMIFPAFNEGVLTFYSAVPAEFLISGNDNCYHSKLSCSRNG
jgi:hypothetical protein